MHPTEPLIVLASATDLSPGAILGVVGAIVALSTALAAAIVRIYTAKPERDKLATEAQKERSSIVNEAADLAGKVYRESIASQQADLDRMRKDNKEVREELTAAREEIARLQERLQIMGEQRDHERDALLARITELQAQVTYLETKVGGRRGGDPSASGVPPAPPDPPPDP